MQKYTMQKYTTGAIPPPPDAHDYRIAAEADIPLLKEVGGAE